MALTAQEIRQRDLQYKKQNYEWAKARGLCVRCMKERAAPGRYKCLECLSISVELNNACNAKLSQDEKKKREERNRESMKTLYAQRKAAGLCTACGKPAYKGQAFCNECRLRRNRKHRERYVRKPVGECRYCERPALPGRQMCKEHYERDLEILEYARSQRKTDPVRDAINDFWKLKKREDNMDDFDKKVLLSLEKNRMMISKVARELFCHRHTITYRLDKLKKETGVDPLEVRGLVALLDRIGGQA